MTVDVGKFKDAYDRYLRAVSDPALPEKDRRIDLKHMRFWHPYYAQVIEAIAVNKKPRVERRTLTEINTQSQLDYECLTNQQIFDDLDEAQMVMVRNITKISEGNLIPYRKSTKYPPERYVDTIIDHFRMHWDYLEKLKK